jgi:ketosteroid isomerase-like protein
MISGKSRLVAPSQSTTRIAKEQEPMRTLLIALAAAVLAAGPAAASDETDVMASVHQFVDAFNGGDTKTAAAACADQTSIIDEFPPYEWHGTGSCSTWMSDFDTDAKKNGITDGIVKLDNPRHVAVTADRAYVVVPASYTFKQKGKVVEETGSLLTVALRKGRGGWRITGWSWSKN